MSEPRAQRTLVKSPPELWAEISDVSTLARHLGEFGDIRITRLEAETTVVWEGDRARGTVNLEPSGWGTKVTITAEAVGAEAEAADAADATAEITDAEVVEAEAEDREAEAPHADTEADPPPTSEAPAVAETPTLDAPTAEAPPTTAEEPAAAADEPAADAPPTAPQRRRGLFARLFGRRSQTERVAIEAVPEPDAVAETEPEVVAAARPDAEPEILADAEPVAVEPEVVPTVAGPEPEAEPVSEPVLDGEIVVGVAATAPMDRDAVEAVLVGVLDDLGSAHHRPFSRG
jgi:hypothetical protein